MLLAQLARRAFSRARAKAGNKIAASMAMMAMTTKSSIKVKAARCGLGREEWDMGITAATGRFVAPRTE